MRELEITSLVHGFRSGAARPVVLLLLSQGRISCMRITLSAIVSIIGSLEQPLG